MTDGEEAAAGHLPVMRERVVELIVPALEAPGSVIVDATLGLGGHAEAILASAPSARLVGIDRDPQALALARERLTPFADRLTLVHAVYDELPEVLDDLGLTEVQALLFDLGVSSLQLDEPERGFAYAHDAPLDMRMDQTSGMTAAEVLNTYAAADLERILRQFGEERFARRIARAVVRRRERRPFERSGDLVELLRDVVPAGSQRSGGHPAKRTFQALRIEVNTELSAWQDACPAAIDALAVGGRMAVLSYHSLEDRITKQNFATGARSSAPPGMPVELPEHAAYLRLLTRGGEQASDRERAANPRSASARLRAVERIRRTGGGHR